MTQQEALNKLFAELDKSPNFKYLPVEKQAEIRLAYSLAQENEIAEAWQLVKKDTAQTMAELTNIREAAKEALLKEKAAQIEEKLKNIKAKEASSRNVDEADSEAILKDLL